MKQGHEYRERLYKAYVSSGQADASDIALARADPFLQRLVRRHFPGEKDARILELGCGHGALIAAAQAAGYSNIAGVDVSPEQVAIAKAKGIAGVGQGDLNATLNTTPLGSVDALVLVDVLEHFDKEEVVSILRRACGVLKRGGRLIVHVPNADTPFFGAIYFGDFTHETCFSPQSLSQVLKASGFGSVICYEDGPIVHGVKSAVRWVLWKGIRGFLRFWSAVETGDTAKGAIFTRNFLAVAFKP